MTDLDRALGRAWRDDAPWRTLSRLAELPDRLGGHEGERRAADIVAEALADAGVRDVTRQSFSMTRWTRGAASFSVTAPVERAFEAVALPYSPGGEVTADIVDAGYGTPEEIDAADVDGNVVVASTDTPPDRRFLHRMEKYGHAVDAGAAAFVFANHVEGQLPPTGALRFDAAGEIPGVGVSKEDGAWLREYAERGATVSVGVDAGTDPGESRNVHGVLGPDGADEEVVALAHYDAHDVGEGALDNACGVAVLVGAARVLAELDLDCRVRVAGVGCEELGLLGSEALADVLDLDAVRAVVNVDGAGRFRDLRAFTHASDAMNDLVDRVADETGHPVVEKPDPHPFSDHWPFLRDGVPALQLHSESGERGRGWTHTRADTRDKVDRRNLRSHAMLAALLIRELVAADDAPPRVDPATLREAFRERAYESGMRAAGVWPDEWG
ncbi:M28 family peptidase [Halostella sp. JP-L12]|uniref:M28 family metallopeptidase n=1 Tax=Halostella TaxID=1843185 RepID=UPI000EF78EFB|nr:MULTISPECIES: M28 family metallopeptidase [Halostella]NHN46950.1 M28 family peptidase [Halostella sp. JP-L12]